MTERPDATNSGNIHIDRGSIIGGVVSVGHGSEIHASDVSVNTSIQVDTAALKASLQELFNVLRIADLPMQTQMDALTATGLAKQQADGAAPNFEEMAGHVQQVGQTLQKAHVVVEKVPQRAAAVMRIAHVLGPVFGGAKVVAGWFGFPLP